jgi:hypothetical protein
MAADEFSKDSIRVAYAPGTAEPSECARTPGEHARDEARSLRRHGQFLSTDEARHPRCQRETKSRGFLKDEPRPEKGVCSRTTPVPELVLSDHAAKRCQQRGIRPQDLWVALQAKPAYNHGYLVYRVTDRLLAKLGLHARADRLRGLTVVVDTSRVVRTVKWDFRLRKTGPLCRSRRLPRTAPRRAQEKWVP